MDDLKRLLVISRRNSSELNLSTIHEKLACDVQHFLAGHYERLCYSVLPEPTRSDESHFQQRQHLLFQFQLLERVFLELVTVLSRNLTRIEHLQRSLAAMQARRARVRCQLHANRSISQFSEELMLRKREERAARKEMRKIAIRITQLGVV